jgi:asparagine synthase (glutamine-hydrolysing)
MYVDTRSFLSEGVLVKVDRMSMAHGLEVRSPLLDHRIYEFAANLATSHKVRGMTGKRLLRAAARRVLPDHVVRRPKQGFEPPRRQWLTGALRPLLESALNDTDSGLVGLIDGDRARGLWREMRDGGADESPALWTLLCLDLWRRSVRESRPRFEVLEGGREERLPRVVGGGA